MTDTIIDLPVTEKELELLAKAADISGVSVETFVLEAAVKLARMESAPRNAAELVAQQRAANLARRV